MAGGEVSLKEWETHLGGCGMAENSRAAFPAGPCVTLHVFFSIWPQGKKISLKPLKHIRESSGAFPSRSYRTTLSLAILSILVKHHSPENQSLINASTSVSTPHVLLLPNSSLSPPLLCMSFLFSTENFKVN